MKLASVTIQWSISAFFHSKFLFSELWTKNYAFCLQIIQKYKEKSLKVLYFANIVHVFRLWELCMRHERVSSKPEFINWRHSMYLKKRSLSFISNIKQILVCIFSNQANTFYLNAVYCLARQLKQKVKR